MTSQQRSQDESYLFRVSYQYNASGAFAVHLNASNAVSWMLANTTAVVDIPITGVAIETQTTFAEVGVPVTFTAAVESGENLKYRWKFGEQCVNTT